MKTINTFNMEEIDELTQQYAHKCDLLKNERSPINAAAIVADIIMLADMIINKQDQVIENLKKQIK